MTLNLLFVSASLISLSVVAHVTMLMFLTQLIKGIFRVFKNRSRIIVSPIAMAIAVFGVIIIHLIEAGGWAAVYMRLNEFDQFEDALYFSIVTVTTLGYGDIVLSEQWRLLSTFEAIGGLILFGASTAFLIGLMKLFFDEY